MSLPAEVESLGGGRLHAIGQLEGLNSGLQGLVPLHPLQVQSVHAGQQVDLPLLFGAGQVGVAQVGDDLVGVQILGVDEGSRIDARQKAAVPGGLTGTVAALVTDGNEGGQVLVFRAQAVSQPGPDAGPVGLNRPCGHHQQSGHVLRKVGMHGVDDAEIVDALSHVGKELADPAAGLAMALELEGRLHQALGLALGLDVHGRGALAVVFLQQRLVVEGVHVGDAAVHQQVDHSLGPGGKVRRLGGQGVAEPRFRGVKRAGVQPAGLVHHGCQSQGTDSRADPAQ